MRIVTGVCIALIIATIAGAIGGWWAFGIVAVVGAIIVISVANSGAPAGGAGSPPTAGSGGSKKSQAVTILENIGGIISIVIFGFLAITLLGMIQDCGGAVKEGWDKLDEVYTGNTTPTDTSPVVTPPPLSVIKTEEGKEQRTFPAGTALHFVATGKNCEEWQHRIMNSALKKVENEKGKEIVRWVTVKESSSYWTLNRDGWIDVRTQEGCQITVQPVQ